MSNDTVPKTIQYYELMDLKNILEKYAKETDSEILSVSYREAIENIKKILAGL